MNGTYIIDGKTVSGLPPLPKRFQVPAPETEEAMNVTYKINGKTTVCPIGPEDRDERRDLLVSRLCALKTSDRQKPRNKEGHNLLTMYDTYDEIFRRIDDEMDDVDGCNDENVVNRCSRVESTIKDVMIGASHLVDSLRDVGAGQEATFVQKEALQKREEARDVFRDVGLMDRFFVPTVEIREKSFRVVVEEDVEAPKLQPGSVAEVPTEHTTQELNADADSWKPRSEHVQFDEKVEVKTFVSSEVVHPGRSLREISRVDEKTFVSSTDVQPGSEGGADLVIDNVLEDIV